jgi:hypothetical protein
MKFKSARESKTGPNLRRVFRFTFLTSAALLLCVPFVLGSPRIDEPKSYVAPSPAPQNQPQEQSDVKTFSGKVLSQNGVRYILRDDVNDVWYHLDDQKQAEKFAGKNVLVTGVLDGPTDTIHVREITEAKA